MAYAENLEETIIDPDKDDAMKVQNELKRKLQTTIVSNVFGEDEFKESFLIVFEEMAKILSKTLGPYGSSTMIDEQHAYTVTKDGFHVLQNLRFADIKQNRIRSTLYAISHQMVTKVGDGSTSAVVAAYTFLNSMLDFSRSNFRIRPKELNERIKKVVDMICDEITKNAIPVTDDNFVKVVHQVANIATNENEVYTEMITNIYKELGINCTINMISSDTFEDSVTYENGVYTTNSYMVDNIYINKKDKCFLKDCAVLMFDHVLDADAWSIFEVAYNAICHKAAKTLIVIAPSYDQFLMDKMRKDAEETLNMYRGNAKTLFRVVFLKAVDLHKPHVKNMYKDLSALLGANIYQPADREELQKKFEAWEKENREAFAQGNRQGIERPQEIDDDLKAHIGYADEAVLGTKDSSFKGFSNKNEALFEKLYNDAKLKLEEEERRVLQNDAVDNKVFAARTRFTKISCKSATINVGGSNRLERSVNMDAVDDAVKACASAVKYGYNKGCNFAILTAVDNILASSSDMDEVDRYILSKIKESFLNVYEIILKNGLPEKEAEYIVEDCKDNKDRICYNLAIHEYDKYGAIINSCRTDIEILKGAIAMVGIVLTCNQYISSTLNH